MSPSRGCSLTTCGLLMSRGRSGITRSTGRRSVARGSVGGMWTIVRVTAPNEEHVGAPFLYEQEAVDRVREIEAGGVDGGVYYEVRDESGRAVWTSESGELERT